MADPRMGDLADQTDPYGALADYAAALQYGREPQPYFQ
jgi:hypothetical protein